MHTTLEYLPLNHNCQIHVHQDSSRHSTPDPSPKPVPQLAGIPAPSPKPTALQVLLSPSYAWDDQTPPLGLSLPIRPCQAPALCGTIGAPPCWDGHQPGMRQLHPATCQEPHPSGGAGPSSTGFPDNRSTRLLLHHH
jgi:hypothetical protein